MDLAGTHQRPAMSCLTNFALDSPSMFVENGTEFCDTLCFGMLISEHALLSTVQINFFKKTTLPYCF
ncbi:hypothetical protein COLO4_33635 [Corchorus olitorius]|uniref:Uncharacterized protein n=1 Tax=Corchorus olitorius TaxID=93759 RepID=A0A1R3GSG0_9ROSI|nr:hypothetical protein COLO4_33635 [Corchorus olitorius]